MELLFQFINDTTAFPVSDTHNWNPWGLPSGDEKEREQYWRVETQSLPSICRIGNVRSLANKMDELSRSVKTQWDYLGKAALYASQAAFACKA